MILRTCTCAIKVSLLVILGYDNCTSLLYRFLNQFNSTIDGLKNKWVFKVHCYFFLVSSWRELVLGAGFHVKKAGFLFIMEPSHYKQRSPIFIKESS
uniref:Uncharacterized protein n=2 Tax=Musa acuminata subsp. malaccensis TaxID=214687 RepID=A0A804HXP4_MUSAM